ncbi:MAG: hypothetical protein ACMUIA_00260 [bacterium]
MKRILTVIILTFAMLYTFGLSRVSALELDFTGEYRNRGWWLTNFDINTTELTENSAFWDNRFRLQANARISDDLEGVVRLLAADNENWGTLHYRSRSFDPNQPLDNRQRYNVHADLVEVDLAYVKLNLPNTPFMVKLGKMDLNLGHSIVLGSEMTWDTLALKGVSENIHYGLFTAKYHEGDVTMASDDIDLYGLYINLNPQEDVNFGIYAVYGNHSSKDPDRLAIIPAGSNSIGFDNSFNTAYWIGVTSTMNVEPLKVKFEFDHSNLTLDKEVTGDNDRDTTGFAAYADVSGMAANLTLGGSILFASGEEAGQTGDSDAFSPIFSRFSYMNDYDLITLYWVRDDILTNMLAFQFYLKGRMFDDQVTTKLSAQYYQLNEEEMNDKVIGTEIDARISFNIYQNLSFTGKAGYLLTDSEYFGEDDDDIWLLGHEWVFSF